MLYCEIKALDQIHRYISANCDNISNDLVNSIPSNFGHGMLNQDKTVDDLLNVKSKLRVINGKNRNEINIGDTVNNTLVYFVMPRYGKSLQ